MAKRAADHSDLLDRLAALSDLARLRTLRLLARQELSVGELARALRLPQSTISRHLKLLHDGGWIVKRAQGTASLFRLDADSLDERARALWEVAAAQVEPRRALEEDDHRLAEVLASRRTDSTAFFGRVGGEWDALRADLFGAAFVPDALLRLLPAEWIIADLGCGTGNVAELLAPIVRKVIAVDREPAMLDAARRRLAAFRNIDFRRGDLEKLPLRSREADAALVFLVLHHLPDPAVAFVESARILKSRGALLIVDMVAHDREEYRHTMGHRHLGFDAREIERWARAAGLRDVSVQRLRPDTASRGPGLFAAAMRRR